MPRVLLIYLLILPLAALMGFMLATPTDFSSFAFLLMGFGLLTIPILLRSYQFLLVCTWNAAIIVFFLPGQPVVGTVLAFLSLGIAIITRTMSKQKHFLSVPSLSLSLIALSIVVLITAKLTGGIG